MAIRSSPLRLLLLIAVASYCTIINAFSTSPLSSRALISPTTTTAARQPFQTTSTSSSFSPSRRLLYNSPNDDNNEMIDTISSTTQAANNSKIYTPLDRPLLAIIDTISLVIFAAIGKSSHSDDGTIDILAVFITAFPFITSWLSTSPITGTYSPDDRDTNIISSTAIKIGKGWILAIPLGIALRGVIKGYVPPTPFIIITLISTFVILTVGRILFSLVEDFFVEFV